MTHDARTERDALVDEARGLLEDLVNITSEPTYFRMTLRDAAEFRVALMDRLEAILALVAAMDAAGPSRPSYEPCLNMIRTVMAWADAAWCNRVPEGL